jgi:tetratricopeptide (TPR) repeat protein
MAAFISSVRKLLLCLLLVPCISGFAQRTSVTDSLKKELAKANTPAEKVYLLDILSRAAMNASPEEGEKYGKQIIEVAEESRERPLMIKAYKSNGLRCSYFGGNRNYINRSIDYFSKALAIAKEKKIDEEVGATMLHLSRAYLSVPDKDKALNYATQAFSILSASGNDSLKIEASYKFGDVCLVRNDKILALRSYLSGLRMAEGLKKNNKSRPTLIRQGNIDLSGFYSNIEDYDRAIDYYNEAYKELDNIKSGNTAFMRVSDINTIGNLYARKKSPDIAISYFERSLRMADSLNFPNIKIPAYVSLLNQHLRMQDPKKALDYFNSPPGMALQKFLKDFGFLGVTDQAYAVIYTELNQYDSAAYYFKLAAPYFETTSNEPNRINFYAQLANLHKKTGDNKAAIDLLLKVKELSEKTGELEGIEEAAKELDTLYARTGNYQLASQYNSIYYTYKDSTEKINKENEIAQVEAADEQLRQERLEKEREEAKRKRFNIQYLGITIGIAALFICLVMLGMFKVSRTTIRMIGFFTFLMFFEFIFLIFKKNINTITDGEPWKDLLFMICLAAILLPLHHWMEHKVIHFLTSHNRLTAAGKELKTRLFSRKKTEKGDTDVPLPKI